MIFTMSCETRSSTCKFLLQIFHLAVLIFTIFVTCSGACTIAAVKALTRLYADIIRRFEKKPFRFLDLPPELRILVYERHFALYRKSGYQKDFGEKAMLPDAILGVNRQVYEEAAHVLYSKMEFDVKVTGVANVHGDTFARAVPLHLLSHMSTINLNIYWPQSDLRGLCEKGGIHDQSFKGLKANFNMACTGLAEMPHLRTIQISFFEQDSSDYSLSLMKYLIHSLLRPLELIRRANPELVVNLDKDCLISTAELAELETYCQQYYYNLDQRRRKTEHIM